MRATLLLLALLLAGQLTAQELAHTVYTFTPMQVNPAEVAANNDLALIFNNRSQRYNLDLNFNTALLTAKVPFLNSKGRRWGGFGLSFYSDQSGALDELNLQGLSGAFAYNVYLNKRNIISFGLSGTAYRRTISTDALTTGSQWIPNVGFSADQPLGEDLSNLQSSFVSVGAGLRWQQEDDQGRILHYLGVAAYHLNGPDDSFFDAANEVPMRLSVQGASRVFANDRFGLTPGFWYLNQDNSSFYNLGVTLSHYFTNTNPFDPIKSGTIDLRLAYTNTQSMAVSLVFHQPSYQIAISQDLGLSNAADLNVGGNATEVAISIRKTLGTKKTKPRVIQVSDYEDYNIGELREFDALEDDEPQAVAATPQEQPGTELPADLQGLQDKFGLADLDGRFQFELNKDFKFAFNDASLSEEARDYLDDLATLLQSNDRLSLRVVGHTDNVGSASANRKVSLARADAVVDYLSAIGITKKRMRSEGKGDSEPLVDNETESNRAVNRRVELIIYLE